MVKRSNADDMSIDYERFFNSLAQPYIAFLPDDPTFTIAAENEAHASIAFSSRASSIGKPVFDVFPDNSEAYKTTGESALLNSFRKVMETKEPDVMPLLHYDVKDKNGAFIEKWWRVTHFPVFDEAGKLMLICQSTDDITNEHRTAEKFERAQGQLDSALGIGLVSTWAWDIAADLVIGDVNLARSFGVDPKLAAKGLPLKVFTDSIHIEDRSRVVKAISASIESGVEFEQEYRTVLKKHDTRWVIARGKAQLDAEGHAVQLLGVIVDISERKKAEAELVRIENMFTALFESTVVSIAMADMKGNVLSANKTFLRTFGYTKADLKRGLTSEQITSVKSRGVTAKIYDELGSTGESKPMEKEYVRKDGSKVPMLVGAAMLPNEKDRFIAFMLDVSENKELRELNRTKDEFIGMASHQLRTPATAVKQYISLLQTGFAGALPPEQQTFADRALVANERQLEIVNDLLKTAQIDSDRYIFTKDNVAINSLITHAVYDLRAILEQREQKVVTRLSGDDVMLFIDMTELNLVLVNLLENASKYSPEGSTIIISGSVRGNYARISVKDHGVGIALADQSRIFEKFTRVDNSLSNTVGGSGLGLYWVRRIVHLHGGDVKVSSASGKGSTFTIELPYEPASAQRSHS